MVTATDYNNYQSIEPEATKYICEVLNEGCTFTTDVFIWLRRDLITDKINYNDRKI